MNHSIKAQAWALAALAGLSAACHSPSDAHGDTMADGTEKGSKDCCAGKNECKGKGGCAVPGKNSCAGKNECKGKGGCSMNCPPKK